MKALSIRLVSSEEDWMLGDWFDRLGKNNDDLVFMNSDQNEFSRRETHIAREKYHFKRDLLF
jgi:hypothetical protein